MSDAAPVRIWVPGEPQPGGSKRAYVVPGKGGGKPRAAVVDDAKGSKDWKSRVALFAGQAMAGRSVFAGPVSVRVLFFTARPKDHFGTGRNAGRLKSGTLPYPTKKPDATKLWRSTEDALTGVVWKDDVQVVKQTIEKHWGDNPGALIDVSPI